MLYLNPQGTHSVKKGTGLLSPNTSPNVLLVETSGFLLFVFFLFFLYSPLKMLKKFIEYFLKVYFSMYFSFIFLKNFKLKIDFSPKQSTPATVSPSPFLPALPLHNHAFPFPFHISVLRVY